LRRQHRDFLALTVSYIGGVGPSAFFSPFLSSPPFFLSSLPAEGIEPVQLKGRVEPSLHQIREPHGHDVSLPLLPPPPTISTAESELGNYFGSFPIGLLLSLRPRIRRDRHRGSPILLFPSPPSFLLAVDEGFLTTNRSTPETILRRSGRNKRASGFAEEEEAPGPASPPLSVPPFFFFSFLNTALGAGRLQSRNELLGNTETPGGDAREASSSFPLFPPPPPAKG